MFEKNYLRLLLPFLASLPAKQNAIMWWRFSFCEQMCLYLVKIYFVAVKSFTDYRTFLCDVNAQCFVK